MSRFNTGNPLGSGDPRDLDDNAKNMDLAVNSDAPQWTDRFGRPRLPLMEQERQFVASQESRDDQFQSSQDYREDQFQLSQDSRDDQFQSAQSSREAVFSDFLQASGYQDLGEYAPGIEITAHNQYVTFGGQPYLLKPSIPVPYTTSGEWTGDDFKLIGDDSLRQDLANPGKGAAMLARGVVAVDSIADLLALPEGQRKEGLRYLVKGYHAGSDVGGGEFYWDATSTQEEDGGVVFAPTGAEGRFIRIVKNNTLSFSDFGCRADGTDQTVRMQAALSVPHNLTSPPGMTYITSATLFNQRPHRTVDFRGSTLSNKSNSRYAIVTVSEALEDRTDSGLAAFGQNLHYDEKIENSHIKSVIVDMSPSTSGGANAGVGIVYGKGCTIMGCHTISSNGNGAELRHSEDCIVGNGSITGARNYGVFCYMTKNCIVRKMVIGNCDRGTVFKHAHYDDPNVNGLIDGCTYYNVANLAIGGGASAGTGVSPAQEPEGHEIVRGVTAQNCWFLVSESAEQVNMASIQPGRHADKWTIRNNWFYCPKDQPVYGFAINLGGEGTVGYFNGGGHEVHENHFIGGVYTDAVITTGCSAFVDRNHFDGVKALRLMNFGSNRDGGRSSFKGNEGVFKLMGGGSGEGGVVQAGVGHPRLQTNDNTFEVHAVERPDSSWNVCRFFTGALSLKAEIKNNTIIIHMDDPAITECNVISAHNSSITGNTIEIYSSISGATLRAILSTAGAGSLIAANDLSCNDASGAGAAIKTAMRVAAGSVLGVNRYSGWDTDEQVLP